MLQGFGSTEKPRKLLARETQHFLPVLGYGGIAQRSEPTGTHHGQKTQTHLPLGISKILANATTCFVQLPGG